MYKPKIVQTSEGPMALVRRAQLMKSDHYNPFCIDIYELPYEVREGEVIDLRGVSIMRSVGNNFTNPTELKEFSLRSNMLKRVGLRGRLAP